MTQTTQSTHDLSITSSLVQIEGSVIAEKALLKMDACDSDFMNYDIIDDALSFATISVMTNLTPLQEELVGSITYICQTTDGPFNQWYGLAVDNYYECEEMRHCSECQSGSGLPCSTHG